ncbi:MAG: transposase [Candidatus Omnitrophota bacterium]
MARPLRIEYPGAFYHIIQRGSVKEDIFISEQDRLRFYDYLSTMHTRYKVRIHTYCLMNNHYHLIMETEEANLTKAVHYLNTSYTVYFNVKNKRSGHLFQGRYKAILVEADEYLHQLSRYIHLNPVRAGAAKEPEDYPYSSYKYFISTNMVLDWLDTGFILSLFNSNVNKAKTLYKEFVLDGIGKEKDSITKNTHYGLLLGGAGFIEDIKARFISGKQDKEVPVLTEVMKQLKPEKIKSAVIKEIEDAKLARRIAIYLIRKHTALRLTEIAALFGNISDAGVSALYHRETEKRIIDKELNKKILRVEELLRIET